MNEEVAKTMHTAVATIFVMPCLLMVVSVIVGRKLEAFPGKDDIWQLPRESSLR